MSSQSERADTPEEALAFIRAKPYRYEAKVTFIVAADGLDEAAHMQKQIVEIVQRHTNERVMDVRGSILDLKHRPDLDGSLRG